jgi:hypothetical protein
MRQTVKEFRRDVPKKVSKPPWRKELMTRRGAPCCFVALGSVARESQAIYEGYTGGLQADYRRFRGGYRDVGG